MTNRKVFVSVITSPFSSLPEIDQKDARNVALLSAFIISGVNVISSVLFLSRISFIDFPIFGVVLFSVLLVTASVISFFTSWLILSFIYYLVATILGGEGNFKDVFLFFGCAQIPFIFTAVLRIVALIYMEDTISISVSQGLQSPQTLLKTLLAVLNPEWLRFFSVIIGLWVQSVGCFTLIKTQNLTVKKTLLCLPLVSLTFFFQIVFSGQRI